MTMRTKEIYLNYAKYNVQPEKAFRSNYPEWKLLDRITNSWLVRITFGIAYVIFYYYFATYWWMYLLLPIHFFMGPIHGAIVNWCGHKYGYANFNNGDHSKNTEPWGILLMGELFQNNHHKYRNSPNFAKKWFEFDPTYVIMILMNGLRIIRLKKA